MATGQRPSEGRFTRRRSPQNVTAPRQGQRFYPLVQGAASATDYGASAQNANLIAQAFWWGGATAVTGTIGVTDANDTSSISGSSVATDDFTFTGTDGASWGPGWTFTQGTGDILTNRGRMVTGTGGFDGRSARYDTGTVDISLRIDVEIPTADAQFPELRLRYDSTNQDYVRLLFEPHNDTVFLHDYDNDVQQGLLDSASFAFTGGDTIHIRAVMVGTSHLIRLWSNADPEPSTWQLEATTSFGAGNDQLMVRTVTSNLGVAITNYWDNFSYAPALTGTAAVTDAADTSTISGTETFTGAVAVTDANDTSAFTGTVAISGTIGVTDANDTSTASGTLTISGTVAVTDANDTSAMSGTETFTGTITVTDAADTSAISGTETFTGTIAVTDADDTSAITGDHVTGGVTGTIAVGDADDAAAFTGDAALPSYTGTIGVTDDDDTSAITAGQAIPGTITITEARDTSAITGGVVYNPVGTSATIDADDVATLTGSTFPNPTGTSATTDADDTSALVGVVANPVSGAITIIDVEDRTSISALRFGKAPREIPEPGPQFPSVGRRRRYYDPARNPVHGS